MLGGLWPLTRGRIYKPGGGSDDAEGGLSHDIFYVPQRPYVTQVGSARAAGAVEQKAG